MDPDRLYRNGETFTVELHTSAPDAFEVGVSGGGYAKSGDMTWSEVPPVSFKAWWVEVDSGEDDEG